MDISLSCIRNIVAGDCSNDSIMLICLLLIGRGFYYHELYSGSYFINDKKYGFWHQENRLYFFKKINRPLFTTNAKEQLMSADEIIKKLKNEQGIIITKEAL